MTKEEEDFIEGVELAIDYGLDGITESDMQEYKRLIQVRANEEAMKKNRAAHDKLVHEICIDFKNCSDCLVEDVQNRVKCECFPWSRLNISYVSETQISMEPPCCDLQDIFKIARGLGYRTEFVKKGHPNAGDLLFTKTNPS